MPADERGDAIGTRRNPHKFGSPPPPSPPPPAPPRATAEASAACAASQPALFAAATPPAECFLMQSRLAYLLASVTNPAVYPWYTDTCYTPAGHANCCGTAGTPKDTVRQVNVLLDGAPPHQFYMPHDGSGPAHVCVCMVTHYDAPWYGRAPWSTEFPDMFSPPDSK